MFLSPQFVLTRLEAAFECRAVVQDGVDQRINGVLMMRDDGTLYQHLMNGATRSIGSFHMWKVKLNTGEESVARFTFGPTNMLDCDPDSWGFLDMHKDDLNVDYHVQTVDDYIYETTGYTLPTLERDDWAHIPADSPVGENICKLWVDAMPVLRASQDKGPKRELQRALIHQCDIWYFG